PVTIASGGRVLAGAVGPPPARGAGARARDRSRRPKRRRRFGSREPGARGLSPRGRPIRVEHLLPNRVSVGYAKHMTKDVDLRIRVNRELRDKFSAVCRAQDKPAAQVIREFMRDYVERHGKTLGNPAI